MGRRGPRARHNRAVDGVDLNVRAGTVYGVLGPNGAGKTTTISMLATLLRPDGGDAFVFGHDIRKEQQVVRQLLGVTAQFASVDETLSANENLMIFARLLGLSGSRSSGCRTPPSDRSRSSPAGCAAASTSRPASSPSRR